MKDAKILIIDDNADLLFALKLALKKKVKQIDLLEHPDQTEKILEQHDYSVIVLDMNFSKDAMSGQEGFDWLRRILKIDPEAVVVCMTAYGDLPKAVQAIKLGATDFILKPFENEKFLATIQAAAKLGLQRRELNDLKAQNRALADSPSLDFLGDSPVMRQVFHTIRKVAQTDASVLILGENGTGKELVARALHENSARRDKVFASVDLGSITETLFESEMFGHVKGAFTDARADRAGRFELASSGTLFLDEIGNLSPTMQAKLLTVLERREVTRVGANRAKPIDIRLVCATNMPLRQLIAEEKFREDLLYRINTVEIQVPPLRERGDDLELLAGHFLELYARKYKKPVREISQAAFKKMRQYPWPGNVRELRHAIERAVIMSDHKSLQSEDFHFKDNPGKVDELELESYNLEELERSVVAKVLKKYNGNISLAAKELGLTRTSLYRRMEKFGL